MTDGQAHAVLGASSSSRWMACPGSVALCQGIPQKDSPYAAEGTKAHEIAADILEGKAPPEDTPIEMLGYVGEYVDYIDSIPFDIRLIEHRFSLDHIFPDMFGTSDCTIYQRKAKHLHVVDLKYGKGVYVDAHKNPQLMYYALGAYEALKQDVKSITMTIVQPRFKSEYGTTRSYTVNLVELFDFSLTLFEAARRALMPKAPLAAGKHCRFCAAKGICPEYSKSETQKALDSFKEFLN